MIRVLTGDPHSVVRAGIRCVLASGRGFRVAGEASNRMELLRLVRATACDVVMVEIAGAGNFWLDLIGQLLVARPRTSVLIFTSLPEAIYGVHALRAGAAGFLAKDCTPDQLIEAVQSVASGRKYIGRLLAQKLAENAVRSGTGSAGEAFSSRELQVLRMIAEGRSVGQVAEEISLSVKTVSTYRSRILKKTKLANNAELMRYAWAQNLI
jgi:two-component system, NarL family, invasion response regulator UvrY